jgi:hypothetical protein
MPIRADAESPAARPGSPCPRGNSLRAVVGTRSRSTPAKMADPYGTEMPGWSGM